MTSQADRPAGATVTETVHGLRRAFCGQVHLPGDGDYDAQRATRDEEFDSQPALVAMASTPEDIRAAVVTAREHDLPFAVQATGHGTTARSPSRSPSRAPRMRPRRLGRMPPAARS